jgi:hypothetical protein
MCVYLLFKIDWLDCHVWFLLPKSKPFTLRYMGGRLADSSHPQTWVFFVLRGRRSLRNGRDLRQSPVYKISD